MLNLINNVIYLLSIIKFSILIKMTEQLINISTGYDYDENYDTTNIDNLNEFFVDGQINI